MLVKHRMSPDTITVTPDTTVPDAYRIIKENKIHHLPVVDKKGKLIGIVARADLIHAGPSPATTLSVFEANYLLARMPVKDIMSEPITVAEDTPLEDAARLMVEKGIGCLPIMKGDKLLGVITETDIFKAFLEILGGGEPDLRITLRSPDQPGELARLTGVIAKMGGNMHSIASFKSEDPQHVYFTFRLKGIEKETLLAALDELGEEVVNVRKIDQDSG
ncbi:MAG: CBS domain-containing protein [Anaerolineae bacterium]|nr:CBS domain-containing protein [Anaerolineae bacterium]